MISNNGIALAVAVLSGLVLFIGGCSGSGYGDAAEPTSTTAAPASRTIEPTPRSTPRTTAAPTTRLTLAASSVRFEQPSLTAPAGIVTIAFDNRDQGISHNVHVFMGSDASGADIGSTEIQAGAVRQTLALGELAAGSYFYQCDVHPSQMMGTLTIS